VDNIEVFSEDITEESAFKRIFSDELYAAFSNLTETQRKRIILYYFYDYTYEQIAEHEGCIKMPVKRSIDDAIKKLRKLLI
jgi:RNA polymerase sigma-70 factor (ECF subfamily)